MRQVVMKAGSYAGIYSFYDVRSVDTAQGIQG